MRRVYLQVHLGKAGAAGAGEHVPARLLNIITASQGKKLFVHAIEKVILGPTMEQDTLTCRENYV